MAKRWLPTKHEKMLGSTYVLLYSKSSFNGSDPYKNHVLSGGAPYNVPANAFCTLQHLTATRKQGGGKAS